MKTTSSQDTFTDKEIDALFGEGDVKPKQPLEPAAKTLAASDKPYIMDTNDPAWGKVRDHSIKPAKSLTQNKDKRTLKVMVKRRKDGGMTKRQKSKLIQEASLGLLAIAAVVGIAELLGGELKHLVVSAILVALLYVHASE